MAASERANWFDTEGNLHVSPSCKSLRDSIVSLCISQSDELPLHDFNLGALTDGVRCRIVSGRHGKKGERMLIINGVANIAGELSLEMPFIRTTRKLAQIQKFRGFVRRNRTRTKETLKIARRLLDSVSSCDAPLRSAMSPRERANWFDAEGCLYVGDRKEHGSREVSMSVYQSQREPLEDFAFGANKNGVASHIYSRRRINDEFIMRIRRLDHIVTEISLELPYLRTSKRLAQVRKLKEYLVERRAPTTELAVTE